MDTRELRRALGSFVTGITIITTRDADDRPVGVTVSSFSSLSLDPPMVLWCLARSARSAETFSTGEGFAAHVLAHDQWPVAERFATPGAEKFSAVKWQWSDRQLPLLAACTAHFECTRGAVHEGGDHLIITGEINNFAVSDIEPLAYRGGRFALTHRGDDAADLMSLQSW